MEMTNSTTTTGSLDPDIFRRAAEEVDREYSARGTPAAQPQEDRPTSSGLGGVGDNPRHPEQCPSMRLGVILGGAAKSGLEYLGGLLLSPTFGVRLHHVSIVSEARRHIEWKIELLDPMRQNRANCR